MAATLIAGMTAHGACRTHWVGSWSASPSDGLGSRLSNQTLRMIVTPHLGGRRVRLRLTNRFGTTAVRLDRVTIAAEGGLGALAARARPVKFRGQRGVTIPPGGDVVSDSLAVRVKPFRNVAISVYVAGDVASATEHFITRQTSYRTPAGTGDHSDDRDAAAFTETTGPVISTGWYFVAGLDVRAPGRVGAVVAFGDSITDGYEADPSGFESRSGVDANRRYPDALAHRLAGSRPLSVLNAGISGNRILRDGQTAVFGPSGLSRLAADALDQPGATDVIVLEGINDIGQTPASADDVIGGLTALVQAVHARGLRVLLGTLTPAGSTAQATYGNPTADGIREQVNAWIRTQTAADGVVDFDAAVRDAADPSRLVAGDDSGDHLHPSGAGYAAMAAAVDLGLLRGSRCGGR